MSTLTIVSVLYDSSGPPLCMAGARPPAGIGGTVQGGARAEQWQRTLARSQLNPGGSGSSPAGSGRASLPQPASPPRTWRAPCGAIASRAVRKGGTLVPHLLCPRLLTRHCSLDTALLGAVLLQGRRGFASNLRAAER